MMQIIPDWLVTWSLLDGRVFTARVADYSQSGVLRKLAEFRLDDAVSVKVEPAPLTQTVSAQSLQTVTGASAQPWIGNAK